MIAVRRGAEIPVAGHGGRHVLAHAERVRHDFSVCLNAFGPSAIVRDAIRNSTIDEYPDPDSGLACATAAKAWSVSPDCVMLGAGSAEIIDLVCRAFVGPGDVVAVDFPAFGEYERAARLYGARIVRAADHDAHVVFVCTPSNPLGVVRSNSELRGMADRCAARGALLVIDQAYDAFIEFPMGTPALPDHPAVLHMRSMTKEHAIAGVRVAFAIGSPEVISALNAVRVPWSASSIAQSAAIAAFSLDAGAHVKTTTAALRLEALRMRASLETIGYETADSATHFFLIRVRKGADARQLLLDCAGVLVRDCTSFGLADWIRVAARRPHANDDLLDALRDLSPQLLPRRRATSGIMNR